MARTTSRTARTTDTAVTPITEETPMSTDTAVTPDAEAPAYPTVDAYRAADVKGKAAIRRDVDTACKAAIKAGDLSAAQAAMSALDAYKTAGTSAAPTVDYAGLVAARIRAFRMAADLLEAGLIRPDGIPAEAPVQVTYADVYGVLSADDTTAATAYASAPIRRAAKRDLNAYLTAAVAARATGSVVLVSALVHDVAALATADGVDYVPSGGAVSAALASKKGVTGASYVPADKARGIKAAARITGGTPAV